MIDLEALTIDARRLWAGEGPWAGRVAFVDLAGTREWPDDMVLPPCPVIGIGARDHPLAALLDTVLEPPFANLSLADDTARRIATAPLAAATTVQLLRLLPALGVRDGLVAESMAYAMLQAGEAHVRWLDVRGQAAALSAGEVLVARDGGRLSLTLNRAQAGNAIDRPMRDALYDALAIAALDPSIETVSLQANGKAFCLGAEMAEFGTTRDPASAHAIRQRTLPAHQAARCADKLKAHVQGACVGAGLELVAFARHITATSSAWFQLPELAMGILPGAGGCVSLSRRIGRQRTALMILSGRRLGARTALDWGLIDAIVDQPA